MSRVLVLACGNALRGDDGVALHIASCANGVFGPETLVHTDQQWTPELAQPISEAETVVFLDASASMPPGEITCRELGTASSPLSSFTHQITPQALLALARDLYGSHPSRAYLLTVGGASFDLKEGLSEPVSHAIPQAIERIKALLVSVSRK
ncbi:MAG TPA: hydrogenase maturation protease [Verrucomicrobiae bacterium]|nr:hydrogenase maturation protease [Verrucomicrobiae bacterium]